MKLAQDINIMPICTYFHDYLYDESVLSRFILLCRNLFTHVLKTALTIRHNTNSFVQSREGFNFATLSYWQTLKRIYRCTYHNTKYTTLGITVHKALINRKPKVYCQK